MWGSRAALNTPALIVDLPALRSANIAAMAAFAARSGLRLRPHAKTHKSVEIARRQIAAIAVGVPAAPSSAKPKALSDERHREHPDHASPVVGSARWSGWWLWPRVRPA